MTIRKLNKMIKKIQKKNEKISTINYYTMIVKNTRTGQENATLVKKDTNEKAINKLLGTLGYKSLYTENVIGKITFNFKGSQIIVKNF